MSTLSDLVAACAAVQSDTHAAASTRRMAAALKAWAPTVTAAPTPTPVPVGALLFSDDFDGTSLDTGKWDVKLRGNFVPQNVSVHDGLLDIVATQTSTGAWNAGEIQGLAPQSQYTGPHYLECSAKLPAGAGTWSAPLWERDAPWGGLAIENDVNEQLGKDPGYYHVTVHNGAGESFGKVVNTGMRLDTDFHRYGCAMYADHADYYFDGGKLATITAQESGLTAWRFTTTPMVALVDLDMGGWGGTITVQPPLHLLVDYVKVWALA